MISNSESLAFRDDIIRVMRLEVWGGGRASVGSTVDYFNSAEVSL